MAETLLKFQKRVKEKSLETAPTSKAYIRDSGGLYVQLSKMPEGTNPDEALKVLPPFGRHASFVFRYRERGTGTLREMGLGPWRDVDLAAAREVAAKARAMLHTGLDPLQEKRRREAEAKLAAAKNKTFSQVADDYIDSIKAKWKEGGKSESQWRASFRQYAEPFFGALPVAQVGREEVLRALNPIWRKKTESANRLRQRIEDVLNYAKAMGYRTGDNPAQWSGGLEHVLPNPNDVANKQKQPALPYDQIGEFMVELRTQLGVGAAALEFAILTATRSGEVREATWREFDLKQKVWTIPKERMKAAREHRVPLSEGALAILKRMEETKTGDLVFPGVKDKKPLSDMSLSAVIKRMNESRRANKLPAWVDPKQDRDVVPHGFRSTFRDWASECTPHPHDVQEMALAHAIKDKTEAAYKRGDLLDKRRNLMDDWDKRCNLLRPAAANVVPLHAAA